MASRLATTVRVASRKLPQTRKAINMVSCVITYLVLGCFDSYLYRLQTPSAISKLKALLKSQEGAVSGRGCRVQVYERSRVLAC